MTQTTQATLTPELAQILVDASNAHRKVKNIAVRDRDRARSLARIWKAAPNHTSRMHILGDDRIFISGTVEHAGHQQVPLVVHNIWIAEAVVLLGQPVDTIPFEHLAPGQTIAGENRPTTIRPGRRASEVSSPQLIMRACEILKANGQDPNNHLSYDPRHRNRASAKRAQTFLALTTCCNRWGREVPDIWRDPTSVRPLSGTPKKLTAEYLDRLLPVSPTGWNNLQKLLDAVTVAEHLINPGPGGPVEMFPLPPSAIVWACYASQYTNGLFGVQPIRDWLSAASFKRNFDQHGVPTAGFEPIRAEYFHLWKMGPTPRHGEWTANDALTNKTRRDAWEQEKHLSYAYYMTYASVAARIVNAWIFAAADARAVRAATP